MVEAYSVFPQGKKKKKKQMNEKKIGKRKEKDDM